MCCSMQNDIGRKREGKRLAPSNGSFPLVHGISHAVVQCTTYISEKTNEVLYATDC